MTRISLAVGNLISICMIAIALILASHAYLFPKLIRIPILIVCWFIMLYFTHCLSHYIVGRILGIEFKYYFLSSSMLSKANIPLISRLTSARAFLTLKLAEKPRGWRGFAMFVAGPLASMFSPLTIVAIAYSYDRFASALLLLLTLGNVVFTGYYSCKYGCMRKGLNALRNKF